MTEPEQAVAPTIMESVPVKRKILGMKLPVLIAAGTGLAAVAVGAVLILAPGGKFDMKGSLTLEGTDNYRNAVSSDGGVNPGCAGSGGYSDMALGVGVTVYNAAGKIVGSGAIDDTLKFSDFCLLSFTIANVPAGDGPYQYEVSHRGRLTVTEDEARAGVTASLGG